MIPVADPAVEPAVYPKNRCHESSDLAILRTTMKLIAEIRQSEVSDKRYWLGRQLDN